MIEPSSAIRPTIQKFHSVIDLSVNPLYPIQKVKSDVRELYIVELMVSGFLAPILQGLHFCALAIISLGKSFGTPNEVQIVAPIGLCFALEYLWESNSPDAKRIRIEKS